LASTKKIESFPSLKNNYFIGVPYFCYLHADQYFLGIIFPQGTPESTYNYLDLSMCNVALFKKYLGFLGF
jgi:hypothetical protein